MKTTARCVLLVGVSTVIALGCDSSPLVAPVASMISVTSSASSLPPGGAATIEAYVIEEAGTPVHDGTVVYFSATLGIVDPAQARTEEGVARTTFVAGGAAGTARVTALSGGAVSGEIPNTVDIVIGQ
jgi:hypothetical protein